MRNLQNNVLVESERSKEIFSEIPLVSIIVPVYNVQLYLADCINSILNQTYENFELILIDDGSFDDSGLICDQFMHKDTRVKVHHIENSGVSAARNLGINYALGQIIVFIDSDDTINAQFLALHLDFIEYDLVLSGIANIYTDNIRLNCVEANILYDKQKIIQGLIVGLDQNIINSPVAKLFKKDIIKNNNISFKSGFSYGEDHLFVVEYLKVCSNMFYISECKYNYFHRSTSSLTNRIIPPSELINYAELVVDLMKSLDWESNHTLYFDRFLIKNYTLACCNAILLKNSELLYIDTKSKIIRSKIINTHSTIFISLCTLFLHFPDKLSKSIILFLLKLKSILKSKR